MPSRLSNSTSIKYFLTSESTHECWRIVQVTSNICDSTILTQLVCRRRPSMTLMLSLGRGRSASEWERLVPSLYPSWQCCWWPLCYKLLKTSTEVLSNVNCQLAILFSYLQLLNNYNWNHKQIQQSCTGAQHHQNWCWWGMVGRWERQKNIEIFNKTLSTGTRPNGETGLFPEAYVEEIKDDGPPAMAPPPLPQVLIFTY